MCRPPPIFAHALISRVMLFHEEIILVDDKSTDDNVWLHASLDHDVRGFDKVLILASDVNELCTLTALHSCSCFNITF